MSPKTERGNSFSGITREIAGLFKGSSVHFRGPIPPEVRQARRERAPEAKQLLKRLRERGDAYSVTSGPEDLIPMS